MNPFDHHQHVLYANDLVILYIGINMNILTLLFLTFKIKKPESHELRLNDKVLYEFIPSSTDAKDNDNHTNDN